MFQLQQGSNGVMQSDFIPISWEESNLCQY